jgi:hypothetical protein
MSFLDILRLFPTISQVDDKRKYLKVVKVKDVSRGESLIDSRWVKLKYKTGILERYYARIVVKGYLRKGDSCCCSASFPITAIPGFFVYDYDTVCAYYQCSCTCTEMSLREKRFQDILSRMMSVSSCSTQFMTSSS